MTDPGNNNALLNQQEAAAVATGIFSEFFEALIGAMPSDVSAAGMKGAVARIARQPDFSIDEPCERGGRIVGSATFTDNTDDNGTGSVRMEMSMTPHGCVVYTGSRSIAVDGDPSLDFVWSASFVEFEFSSDLVYRVSGGIRWDDASCQMDYTLRLSPQGHGSITGTVCGQTIHSTI